METHAPPPGAGADAGVGAAAGEQVADLDGVGDGVEDCSEGSQEGGGDEDQGAKQGRQKGSVKWAPAEAVACCWAQLAQAEYEQIQTLPALRQGAQARYLDKARELKRQGRWSEKLSGGRTPEASAKIRAELCSPEAFWAKADRLKRDVINEIVPKWWDVKDQNRSGWDATEFINETKARWDTCGIPPP